jgi:hypothetical protein
MQPWLARLVLARVQCEYHFKGQVLKSVPTDIEPEEKELEEEEDEADYTSAPTVPSLKHQSLALRPLTFGTWNWMFGVVAELTKPSTFDPPPIPNNTGLAVPNSSPLWNNLEMKHSNLPTQLTSDSANTNDETTLSNSLHDDPPVRCSPIRRWLTSQLTIFWWFHASRRGLV